MVAIELCYKTFIFIRDTFIIINTIVADPMQWHLFSYFISRKTINSRLKKAHISSITIANKITTWSDTTNTFYDTQNIFIRETFAVNSGEKTNTFNIQMYSFDKYTILDT